MRRQVLPKERSPAFTFWLLTGLLGIFWLAGGASRADVLGQVLVRFASWMTLLLAAFTVARPNWHDARGPAIILSLAALSLLVQLIPLPPGLWQILPGRAVFTEFVPIDGFDREWRPISLSPGGTSNALASLVVPAAVMVLGANLATDHHWRIMSAVLFYIAFAAFLGLIQFAGVSIQNPLINDIPTAVSGNFANRNHFALMLAIGCLLAPLWAFGSDGKRWKVGVALAFEVMLVLLILATGSRTGIVLGVLALCFATNLVWQPARRVFAKVSGRAFYVGAGIAAVLLVGAIWLSVKQGRAVSLQRATSIEGDTELRGLVWPIVIELIAGYFPLGSGFGTFDPVFRISEPDALLRPTYMNQAHNDWLQIVMEGGLLGLLLLAGATAWVVSRGIATWRNYSGQAALLARGGFFTIILVMVASITDYPARTPVVMAVLALSGLWLANPSVRTDRSGLPPERDGTPLR